MNLLSSELDLAHEAGVERRAGLLLHEFLGVGVEDRGREVILASRFQSLLASTCE